MSMSANRTYGDELADVFASFAVEKNPTGLSVGIDSAYELGDYIESDWLVEHDRQVAEQAELPDNLAKGLRGKKFDGLMQVQFVADVIRNHPDEYDIEAIRWFLSELRIRLEGDAS